MVVIVAISVSLNNMNTVWYKSLNKPPGIPPDWVFGVVWSLLYIFLVVGVIIATWNQVGLSWNIIVVYTIILVLTLLWVMVFTSYQNIVGGLIILLATLGFTGYMLYLLQPSNLEDMGITNGSKYVPIIFYSLFAFWILCATYFNGGILWLN